MLIQKRTLLLLSVALGLTFSSSPANAQLWKQLGERVKNKVEQKVGDKVDQGVDKASDSAERAPSKKKDQPKKAGADEAKSPSKQASPEKKTTTPPQDNRSSESNDIEPLPLTPPDKSKSDELPKDFNGGRDIDVRLLKPVTLAISTRSVEPEIPGCVTLQYWEGTLLPRNDGKTVAGEMKYHDAYEGAGCKKMINHEAAGMCTGTNQGVYDMVARVSGQVVPHNTDSETLAQFAQREPGAYLKGDALEPGNHDIIRTRLECKLTLRRGTLHTTNNCVPPSMVTELEGKELPMPAFFIPSEQEETLLIHNYGNNKGEIEVRLLR